MFIINEKVFVEKLLNNEIKFVFNQMRIYDMICLLVKYYLTIGTNNIYEKVIVDLKKLYDGHFIEENYHKKIKDVIEKYEKNNIRLSKRTTINIYKSDIENIKKLDDVNHQKLLFTLYCLARYYNVNGWIKMDEPRKTGTIFRLANINCKQEERIRMLGYLQKNGYINGAFKHSNIDIRLDISEMDEIEFKIDKFENLGNQYFVKYNKEYRMCEVCGKMFKVKKMDYSSKYCKSCAKKIYLKNKSIYNQTYYNKIK